MNAKRWGLALLGLLICATVGAQVFKSDWDKAVVQSGKSLDVASGGYFKIGGTAVTASAAELNALASTGLSATELGILNGAVVTTAELNGLDAATSGTAVAGKAVILGATKNIDTIDVTASGLKLGGVAVTATAAELNAASGPRRVAYTFYDVDVAASQTTAAWGMDPSVDVGGASFKGVPAMAAGSIIGISVYANDDCTSGVLTADATIAGTATGLQAVLEQTTNPATNTATQAIDADTFTAGQIIGVKVTTTAEWLPVDTDAVVVVYVEY